MDTVGYSEKSLAQKLGIMPGTRLAVTVVPLHYQALIGPLLDGARLINETDCPDILDVFVSSQADLAAAIVASFGIQCGAARFGHPGRRKPPDFLSFSRKTASVTPGCQQVGLMLKSARWVWISRV